MTTPSKRGATPIKSLDSPSAASPHTTRQFQHFQALQQGDGAAVTALIDANYADLKQMASSRLRNKSPLLTFTPQDLLHEAVARLLHLAPDIENKAHFLAIMSLSMRNIMVETLRARLSDKRHGDRVTYTENNIGGSGEVEVIDILALDSALNTLATVDARASEVLHLTYFAGLNQAAIAETLNIALPTVTRDIRFGRAWIQRAMTSEN